MKIALGIVLAVMAALSLRPLPAHACMPDGCIYIGPPNVLAEGKSGYQLKIHFYQLNGYWP